jgi:hypothetical protein
MIGKLSIEELKIALGIEKNGGDCIPDVNCEDCPYNFGKKYGARIDDYCREKGLHNLFADLLEAEIKRRKTKANQRKLALELNVSGVERLSKFPEEFKAKTKTYISKVTTGSAVVETTVAGLSFAEVKILVDGE